MARTPCTLRWLGRTSECLAGLVICLGRICPTRGAYYLGHGGSSNQLLEVPLKDQLQIFAISAHYFKGFWLRCPQELVYQSVDLQLGHPWYMTEPAGGTARGAGNYGNYLA